MFSWKRPESLGNQVWHTFRAKNARTNEFEEFVVQDLPREKHEEALDHMLVHFLPDEPICKLKNVKHDTAALAEICELWRNVMSQSVTLACFKKNCSEIIGLNMVCVLTKSDFESFKPDIRKDNTWKAVHDFALMRFNLFQHYDVDEVLIAYGLSVSSHYRRRGIATEILRARIPLCKTLKIPLTSTVFTAVGSQKPARSIGFQVDFETPYEELAKLHDELDLSNIETSQLILMSLKIDR